MKLFFLANEFHRTRLSLRSVTPSGYPISHREPRDEPVARAFTDQEKRQCLSVRGSAKGYISNSSELRDYNLARALIGSHYFII